MDRAAALLGTVCVALLACNALVGIEDVTLHDSDASTVNPNDDDGTDPDDPLPGEDDDSGGGAVQPTDKVGLSLGFLHGCARLLDGTVRCWGDNGAGQLGLGVPFDAGPSFQDESDTPVAVPGITDAVAIASGLSHTCVIKKTGKVACWGLNSFMQLGLSDRDRSEKPTDVPGVDDAVSIAGGTSHTCVVKTDKTIACWGANYDGQLGDGAKTTRATAAPVKGVSNVAGVAPGEAHTCAWLEDGSVMCWGSNTKGQLGIGTTTDSLVPKKIAGLTDVVQIKSTADFVCARQKSGAVQCWGANDLGQLGTGKSSTAPSLVPKAVAGLTDAAFVWTGEYHACAVKTGGAIVCWGRGGDGQIGNGVTVQDDASFSSATAVVGAMPARAVWTGGFRSCSIGDDNHAYCWGSNNLGELGNGSTTRAYAAVPVKNVP